MGQNSTNGYPKTNRKSSRYRIKKWVVILFLILLIIFLFFFNRNQKDLGRLRSERSGIEYRLEEKNREIEELKKDLASCHEYSKGLQKSIDSLEQLLVAEKPVVRTTPVRRTTAKPAAVAKPEPITLNIVVKVADQPRVEPVANNNDYQVTTKSQPVAQASAPEVRIVGTAMTFPDFYYDGLGNIPFCLRYGGDENRHLPHLAIHDGIIAVDNNKSGYNWLVTPIDKIMGDWGFTKDGTFFVSTRLVERYLMRSDKGLVEIKAAATGWQAKEMRKSGDYYIYQVK